MIRKASEKGKWYPVPIRILRVKGLMMDALDKKKLLDSLTAAQRRAIAQIIRETDPVQEIGDDGHYAYSIDGTLNAAASVFSVAVSADQDDGVP